MNNFWYNINPCYGFVNEKAEEVVENQVYFLPVEYTGNQRKYKMKKNLYFQDKDDLYCRCR
jgi:hypothetical protein